MRILVIGNSKAAGHLSGFLSKDEDLLVFSTLENTGANFIDIKPDDVFELKEFALANEINLTIVADLKLQELDFLNVFNENGLTILTPDLEALKISSSKSFAKKFIYKNKIQTPKFAFFEKPNLAIDYVKEGAFPIVIKPDGHNITEAPFIAETYTGAKKYIEKLFQNDNKKVLIEDYVFGKEVSVYVISDGFSPFVIDSLLGFENRLFVKGILDDNMLQKIYDDIILPTISSLAREGCEYVGILGFDIIISPDNVPNLIEYNSFFKDLDCEIMLEGTNENWPKMFTDAIVGTLRDNFPDPFSIKKNEEYFGSFLSGDEIVTFCARTFGRLKEYILEDGFNKNELNEALKLWKL